MGKKETGIYKTCIGTALDYVWVDWDPGIRVLRDLVFLSIDHDYEDRYGDGLLYTPNKLKDTSNRTNWKPNEVRRAKVILCGPECKDVAIGDHVLIQSWFGLNINVSDIELFRDLLGSTASRELLVMHEHEILAIFDKN